MYKRKTLSGSETKLVFHSFFYVFWRQMDSFTRHTYLTSELWSRRCKNQEVEAHLTSSPKKPCERSFQMVVNHQSWLFCWPPEWSNSTENFRTQTIRQEKVKGHPTTIGSQENGKFWLKEVTTITTVIISRAARSRNWPDPPPHNLQSGACAVSRIEKQAPAKIVAGMRWQNALLTLQGCGQFRYQGSRMQLATGRDHSSYYNKYYTKLLCG